MLNEKKFLGIEKLFNYYISEVDSMDKRFIEESFPVKEVGEESAKEKNMRHSHISTLHIWWARRPLASSRATNYAALIPSSDDEIDHVKKRNFIIEMCKWENSLNKNLIQKARRDILESNNGEPPKVLDPFTGGGSIPLEALRLGCETYANDYNPVAVLLEKCILEYPQKYGNSKSLYWGKGNNSFFADLKKWSNWVYYETKKRWINFIQLKRMVRYLLVIFGLEPLNAKTLLVMLKYPY